MTNDKGLSLEEKLYLLHVERGDAASVHRDLMKASLDKHMNINCVDPLGRSALIIAIENENMELIRMLLHFKIDAKDALLHAIDEDYVEAVEILLQHENTTRPPHLPRSWEVIDHDVATYTQDITPVILAAHKNNYEILKILLDHGFMLPSPHDVKCGCHGCVISSSEDSLRHSRSRINAYTALVSPSLICLTSTDPILTSFKLSRELKRLSLMENEFKMEYQVLRDQVEDFVTNLLNYARTSEELSTILNYDPYECNEADDLEDERIGLTRLRMAIKYDQKKFVAHPNVQQLLGTLWYDGMPGFRRKSVFGQSKKIFCIACMFPINAIIYVVAPKSRCGQRIRRPFVKFINHSTSYCFFLLLLVLVSQRFENIVMDYMGRKERLGVDRGAPPSYVESTITIYIIGFIWGELKQMVSTGPTDYMSDTWNMMDSITNCLYLTWLGFRLTSWYTVRQEVTAGLPDQKPREQWDAFDPMLISEGVFGAANICSFLKMVPIFSTSQYLGPIQISLGRMVFDILKFFLIYALVLFAFGCGMNQLLWYYADMDRQKCYSLTNPNLPSPSEEHSCEIWRRFANLFETSQSLFWASFGLVDLKSFELTGIKSYTRFWGLLMFGSYCVINVVVLLNLLIAMMSNSYQFISKVMHSIIRRYITREQRKRENNSINEDDINEVKQDINSFKYDLLHVLRNNGMDCSPPEHQIPKEEDSTGAGITSPAGKKERVKERRLMKGFSIGVVDSYNVDQIKDMTPDSVSTWALKFGSSRQWKTQTTWGMLLATATRLTADKLRTNITRSETRHLSKLSVQDFTTSPECSVSNVELQNVEIHNTEPEICKRLRLDKHAINPLGRRILELAKELKEKEQEASLDSNSTVNDLSTTTQLEDASVKEMDTRGLLFGISYYVILVLQYKD